MSSPDSSTAASIDLENLAFAWKPGRPVLDLVPVRIAAGERVFLHGPSGCGKSTLLGLIAGVLQPTRGRITVLGTPIHELRQSRRDRFRAEHIGVIFQMFNLLPFLPVRDNILLGCRFAPGRRAKALQSGGGSLEAEAIRLMERLGLPASLLSRSVGELSVGQQQRVAAARALLGSPEIIIADEPTSALDFQARHRFLDLLAGECARAGSTLLFVSHDLTLAERFQRTLALAELNRAAAPPSPADPLADPGEAAA